MCKQFGCSSAIGTRFVRTLLQLFFIALLLGIGTDVCLLAKTERTNDSERHFTHAQLDGHCGEMSLEGEIHQRRMDDVVLMVPQSYLCAT